MHHSTQSAETIARALGLKRTGRTWRGACPIHGGSSFTVSEKDGKTVFYCWSGCDRGGHLGGASAPRTMAGARASELDTGGKARLGTAAGRGKKAGGGAGSVAKLGAAHSQALAEPVLGQKPTGREMAGWGRA